MPIVSPSIHRFANSIEVEAVMDDVRRDADPFHGDILPDGMHPLFLAPDELPAGHSAPLRVSYSAGNLDAAADKAARERNDPGERAVDLLAGGRLGLLGRWIGALFRADRARRLG
jgi:hypothetical protein